MVSRGAAAALRRRRDREHRLGAHRLRIPCRPLRSSRRPRARRRRGSGPPPARRVRRAHAPSGGDGESDRGRPPRPQERARILQLRDPPEGTTGSGRRIGLPCRAGLARAHPARRRDRAAVHARDDQRGRSLSRRRDRAQRARRRCRRHFRSRLSRLSRRTLSIRGRARSPLRGRSPRGLGSAAGESDSDRRRCSRRWREGRDASTRRKAGSLRRARPASG